MDMRFYWIRDCVRQQQFNIIWRKGHLNRADYFTKHHPASHHRNIRSAYLHENNAPTKNYFDILQLDDASDPMLPTDEIPDSTRETPNSTRPTNKIPAPTPTLVAPTHSLTLAVTASQPPNHKPTCHGEGVLIPPAEVAVSAHGLPRRPDQLPHVDTNHEQQPH